VTAIRRLFAVLRGDGGSLADDWGPVAITLIAVLVVAAGIGAFAR